MREIILKEGAGIQLGISSTGHLFLLESGGGWIMRNTKKNLDFLLLEYQAWCDESKAENRAG